MKSNYYYVIVNIIITRLICMHRYHSILHISTYKSESKLLKTDGVWRTMFRMGPAHAWGNDPRVYLVMSQNFLLGTETYCTPN